MGWRVAALPGTARYIIRPCRVDHYGSALERRRELIPAFYPYWPPYSSVTADSDAFFEAVCFISMRYDENGTSHQT
jgi:hypothetical protein